MRSCSRSSQGLLASVSSLLICSWSLWSSSAALEPLRSDNWTNFSAAETISSRLYFFQQSRIFVATNDNLFPDQGLQQTSSARGETAFPLVFTGYSGTSTSSQSIFLGKADLGWSQCFMNTKRGKSFLFSQDVNSWGIGRVRRWLHMQFTLQHTLASAASECLCSI